MRYSRRCARHCRVARVATWYKLGAWAASGAARWPPPPRPRAEAARGAPLRRPLRPLRCLGPRRAVRTRAAPRKGQQAQPKGVQLAGRTRGRVHGPPCPSPRREVSLDTAPTMFFSHRPTATARSARAPSAERLHIRVSLAGDVRRRRGSSTRPGRPTPSSVNNSMRPLKLKLYQMSRPMRFAAGGRRARGPPRLPARAVAVPVRCAGPFGGGGLSRAAASSS